MPNAPIPNPNKKGKKKVFKALFVLLIGFLPCLLSLWLMRKTHERRSLQFRRALSFSGREQLRQNILLGEREELARSSIADRYYLEGVGYLIGDVSCEFNARSGYLRCAVNPSGPCEGCNYYQPRNTA